jgi:hypothetical protein
MCISWGNKTGSRRSLQGAFSTGQAARIEKEKTPANATSTKRPQNMVFLGIWVNAESLFDIHGIAVQKKRL